MAKKHEILEALEDYFNNTPPEQLKKDFEELEKYNQYGPTIDECLDLGEKHCREIMEQMHKESNNKK